MKTQSETVSKDPLKPFVVKPLVLDKNLPLHFVGVGGVGMSGLARILVDRGFRVSGSDSSDGPYLAMLKELGDVFWPFHDPAHVPENSRIIASSAINPQNPELVEAQKRNLPIYHRSDLLREILNHHDTSIGITGTHGKTTITGMTGLVLEHGGLDPTIIAGGKIPELGINAKSGTGWKYAVAELDESDGTVVQYTPSISVIANLEMDHPDHYHDGMKGVLRAFENFLTKLDRSNTVLFNMDCPATRELYHSYSNRVDGIKIYTLSVPENPDEKSYFMQNVLINPEGGYQGELYHGENHLGRLWLQAPGIHNLGNAMYAAVTGYRLGIPFDSIRKTLENFTGMGRRFERVGSFNGAMVIDDYAHHPTEVKATLKAARELNVGKGRVIAMFQPHRYQRLQSLWDEFIESFDDADEVIVMDVYAAGEQPVEGITGEQFARSMSHPSAEYWPSADLELTVARLKAILTPGDLFITLGAGDITKTGRMLARPAT